MPSVKKKRMQSELTWLHAPCAAKSLKSSGRPSPGNNLGEVEPPPWFTQKIMSQIKQESQKKNLFDKIHDFFTVCVPVKVLASALVAVIAIFLYRISFPEPELIKIEHQIPLFHAEKHTNPQGRSNTLTGPGKIQPAGSNSGTNRMKEPG